MSSRERASADRAAPATTARSAVLGALVVGGVGFGCGFLGPIVLSPEANQGPLLGIFITGPGGTLLGALLGVTLGALRTSRHALRASLGIAAALVAGVTLYFSTPEPEYRGRILDAEIRGCDPPASRREKALEYWNQAVARTTWSEPRAGWKENLERMLRDEPAVVLRLQVLRQSTVVENRKPWNRGELAARPWKASEREDSYFANYAGGSCAEYRVGTRARFLANGETARQWPPEILANLLLLQSVRPAPEEYLRLITE